MEELFKIYTDEQSRINLLLNNFLDTKKKPVNYYSKTLEERSLNELVNTLAEKFRNLSIRIKDTNYIVSYDSIEFDIRNSSCRCAGNNICLRSNRDTIKVIEYSKIIPLEDYLATRLSMYKHCYFIPFLKFIEYYYENGYANLEKIKDIQVIKSYSFEEAFIKEHEGQLFKMGMLTYKLENDKLMVSFTNGEKWQEETSINSINQLLRVKFTWIQPKEEK